MGERDGDGGGLIGGGRREGGVLKRFSSMEQSEE